MTEASSLVSFLADARVDSAVFLLRPDYRALLVAVDGLLPGPSDETSETLLQAAEAAARGELQHHLVEEIAHVEAWREAYRAFGATPRTQLTAETTTALFMLDALDPMTDAALDAAADDLVDHLTRLGPSVHAARRLITAGPQPVEGD